MVVYEKTDFEAYKNKEDICAVLEICKYLMYPWVNWETCHVGQITLI